MNDSFLEDLELGPVEQNTGRIVNHAGRHITTRQYPQSIITGLCTDRVELEALIKQQHQRYKSSSAPTTISNVPSGNNIIENCSPSKDMNSKKKQIDPKDRVQFETKKAIREQKSPVKFQTCDKKGRHPNDKLKPVENVERTENTKSGLSVNDGKKRATGSRERSRSSSDGSAKENSRPSDSSTEVTVGHSEISKEWRKVSSENTKKKGDDSESFVMLNAIKDIVSSYTKMESNKIMRMMQDHYVNSQANLIKQLLFMSDDLCHSRPNMNTSRIETLIQENNRLLENVAFLKNRVEELQKVVEATDEIRLENTALKKKIRELQK